MAIEQNHIEKPYLLLCEGKDAMLFLIQYLNSSALADDKRYSDKIQVLDFGGNSNLKDYLNILKNMDKFDQVTSLAIIRDAEKNYEKACREVNKSLKTAGFRSLENSGIWEMDETGLHIGLILFPLNGSNGTLEDLCLNILLEENNKDVLTSIETFLRLMESSYGRHYPRKHKNMLHTYLSSSNKYVTMQIGLASKAGAFDWTSDHLLPLKDFLSKGFTTAD